MVLNLVRTVASFLQGGLGAALLYLLVVAVLDVIFGSAVGHVFGGGFSLRKLKDFVVTTIGWQHTLAFVGALVLMYLHRDVYTAGAVSALALLYATSILPDLYNKLSTLTGGYLPGATNLAPAPKSGAPPVLPT